MNGVSSSTGAAVPLEDKRFSTINLFRTIGMLLYSAPIEYRCNTLFDAEQVIEEEIEDEYKGPSKNPPSIWPNK